MATKFKKITRNVWVKTMLFLLCVGSICAAVFPLTELFPIADELALFSDDFNKEKYTETRSCYQYMDNAVCQLIIPILDARTAEPAERNSKVQVDREQIIARWKEELNSTEGILYYAQSGDLVVKNIEEETPEAFGFFEKQSYMVLDYVQQSFAHFPKSAVIDREFSQSYFYWNPASFSTNERSADESASAEPDRSQYRIYVALDDEFLAYRQSEFQAFVHRLPRQIAVSSVCLVIFLLSLVCLCILCGKKPEDDAVHLLLIDRIWSEITLAFAVVWPVLIGCLIVIAIMDGYYYQVLDLLELPIRIGTALAMAVWIAALCSLFRNLKAHRFFSRFAVVKFCRWFARVWKKIFHGVFHGISHVGSMRFRIIWWSVLLAVVHLASGFFLLVGFFPGFLFWCLGLAVLDIYVLKRTGVKADQLEEIAGGIAKVRSGNLEYKIPIPEDGILREIAVNANGIAEGLSLSVQKEVKAERMKAELITNVSHDLKTPLTSIINYTELLGKENLSPEVANDYVKVIRKKSEQLKSLTRDLFDISKAQSGNIEVSLERLDLAELVRQAAGEAEERMKTAGLTCKVNVLCKNTGIFADGRLLSRAVENLMGNILKYALPGTRVYIDVMNQNRRISVQFKNISNYEMNFSADEITERFTRGDKARTTEGSGLGLAIAKSYVEACGGRMMISVDGDLFKATLGFDSAD